MFTFQYRLYAILSKIDAMEKSSVPPITYCFYVHERDKFCNQVTNFVIFGGAEQA